MRKAGNGTRCRRGLAAGRMSRASQQSVSLLNRVRSGHRDLSRLSHRERHRVGTGWKPQLPRCIVRGTPHRVSHVGLGRHVGRLRKCREDRLREGLVQPLESALQCWRRQPHFARSAFFERFTRTVGMPPMEYLLAWRMTVAKDLLRRQDCRLAEVAERVGYGSASTFSTAFSRHVGQPPGRYARERPGGSWEPIEIVSQTLG